MLNNYKRILINREFFKQSVRFLRGRIHVQEIQHEPEEVKTKLLKVAIIGSPNAGKSTFINNLMERKVCPTSKKVHTTRAKAVAIFTQDDTQIVFLDTPGLVNDKEMKRFNLEKTFIRDSKKGLKEADLIGVIQDCSNVWTRDRLDIKVIKLLDYFKVKPSFLVLNKIDLLTKKRKLLDLARTLTDNCLNGKPISGGNSLKYKQDDDIKSWPNFQEIFMVSSLTGDGLEDLRNYLIKSAKPNDWLYPKNAWTDKTPEDIILEAVRAKLLDFLPQEIPYELKAEMEFFEYNDNGAISTVVIVHCRNERIKQLVAGQSDGKLRQITESLQNDLQCTFNNAVRIKLVLLNSEVKK